ncbi:TRAP transporter small permease [bacterium AH-315-B06]|nr:TRAP transporter small permease [bacterium AH-315-B06]
MKFFNMVDRVVVVIAVCALIAMMLMTTVSVFGRYFFSAPIPDDLVFSEFLMIFVVFLPFSAVQAAREHVFVTIFTEWMSNEAKVVMETIGVVIGFIVFTVVTMAVWTDFLDAYEFKAYVDGPLELPEYPIRFVAFFGLALFSIRLFVDSITSVYGLYTGTAHATKSEEARVIEAEISKS